MAEHVNPPPDRRPDVSERHLELIDQFTSRHLRVEFAYPPDSTARPTRWRSPAARSAVSCIVLLGGMALQTSVGCRASPPSLVSRLQDP